VVVKDPSKLADDKTFTSKCGAMGVIHMGEKGIQVIYGPQVGEVAAEVHEVLGDQ
jgi:phosphotransferase system IIB component